MAVNTVQPSPAVLAPYTPRNFWMRHRWLGIALLLLIAAAYGSQFVGIPDTLPVIVAPLGLLMGLIIWLLPESANPPTRLLTVLMYAFLVGLLCWPDYLALTLPGLPWITAIRLIGLPMMVTLLLCCSVSRDVRRQILDVLNAAPLVWRAFVVFLITGVLSLAFSHDIATSLNRFAVAQMAWTSVFFASCFVFRPPGRAELFARFLWGIAIFVCVIGVIEARQESVPWAYSIPSFLAIQDENVERFLAGTARAASGIYRAQSKFTTSLGFAEFMALVTPFILHMIAASRRLSVRAGGAATILLIFYCVLKTDSRLGMLGFLISFLLYILVWAVRVWRRDRTNLIALAVMAAYPLMFGAAVVSSFTVDAVRIRVFGGGAAQFSTESRKIQYQQGIPMVLHQPIGHGVGMGAQTLGYIAPGGMLTIDTYFLSVALEYGIIGFFAYYGMILAAIYYLAKALPHAHDDETELIGPLIIALINFFIIKSVFSQQENHALIFMMLGISLVLIHRVQEARKSAAAPDERNAHLDISHQAGFSGPAQRA